MASRIPDQRKQRTRQHVIADLSVNHVERIILEAGYTAQRLSSDYGYDLLMSTFDEHGYVEPGSVYIQLKAAETLNESGGDYVHDLDVRDYNLWVREKAPVIVIVFDASRRRASWLAVQQYFAGDLARRPRRGAKRVRIRVPKRQVVNRRAVAQWREFKWKAFQVEKEQR